MSSLKDFLAKIFGALFFFWLGKESQKKTETIKQLQEEVKAYEYLNNLNEEIKKMDNDELNARLSKWVQSDNKPPKS